MKRNALYFMFITAASLCGAVLRGISLLRGYETESMLPVRGYPLSILVAVLTAIVIITAVILAYKWFRPYSLCTFEQLHGDESRTVISLCILFGAGAAIASAFGMLRLQDQLAEQIIVMGNEIFMPGTLITGVTALMWAFGVASGICMILLAMRQGKNKKITKYTGMLITVPMFWCCFDLVVVYHENSGNPVVSDYSYMLLDIVAIMSAFYGIGSFLYEAKPASSQFFACAGIASYLSFTQMGGTCIWYIFSGVGPDIVRYIGIGNAARTMVYLCTGTYLLLQLAHATFVTTKIEVPELPPEIEEPHNDEQ